MGSRKIIASQSFGAGIKLAILTTLVMTWVILPISFALLSKMAWADISEEVLLSPDDIRIIRSPRIESDLVVHLISNAKKRVWLGTYHITADSEVGGRVLRALEAAALRRVDGNPVDVRVFSSHLSHLQGDLRERVWSFLSYLSSVSPLQYVLFGTSTQGWNRADGPHLKSLIVDDIVLVSGRGYHRSYLDWFDLGTIMKGSPVAPAAAAFESVWKDLVTLNPVNKKATKRPAWLKKLTLFPSEISKPNEKEALEALKVWCKRPPSPVDPQSAYKARVIQNRYLKQMIELTSNGTQKLERKFSDQELLALYEKNQLTDDIVDAVVEKMKSGHRIQIISYALLTIPKAFEAIKEALKRGARVEIITNGKSAASTVMPLGFAAGYYLSFQQMEALFEFASSKGCQCENQLEIHLLKRTSSARYTHAKLIIIDDTVFFGSHNFTQNSTLHFEEMQWALEGHGHAELVRTLFADLKTLSTPVDRVALLKRNGFATRLKRRISRYFEALF